jgi:hypothetical protein
MATPHHKHLAARAITNARNTLGDGWKHVSKDLQWGLVAAEILVTLLHQEESIPAENVRVMMQEVTKHAHHLLMGSDKL